MSRSTDNQAAFTRIVSALTTRLPFVAPEMIERDTGRPLRLRLGANESNFGPSPRAIDAMRAAAQEAYWYGDPECHDLRQKLAAIHSVSMNDVIVGVGIDGLLEMIVRVFVEPGVSAVAPLGTYPVFGYHVRGHGGTLREVPYRNDRVDCEALIDAAKQSDARLFYIANPDNPTGTWHNADTIAELASALPAACVLIVDEAYAEFVDPNLQPSMKPENRRIIHLRTFSKAHGMAGARIGYAVASKRTIDTLGKIRNDFEVSRIAQAGALASLDDPAYLETVVREVALGRAEYNKLADNLNLPTIPSVTNFVCFDFGDAETARNVVNELRQRGVFVRQPLAPPLDRCVRITVGTHPERAIFSEFLRSILLR